MKQNNIYLKTPSIEELQNRQTWMKDKNTMSYSRKKWSRKNDYI